MKRSPHQLPLLATKIVIFITLIKRMSLNSPNQHLHTCNDSVKTGGVYERLRLCTLYIEEIFKQRDSIITNSYHVRLNNYDSISRRGATALSRFPDSRASGVRRGAESFYEF
ncbi:hypothetical protein JYQ62_20155 [Nostoc sp. UHCC 0702]|nr:hypothetical protein JYQ62_20155 [Nostoc sp. UHCC 0702]